ncbi:hypothetical protein ETH_00034825, partial [Eimeria tenella]
GLCSGGAPALLLEGDRVVPVAAPSESPFSLICFLKDFNCSVHPAAPREPATFTPLSPTELLRMQVARIRIEKHLNQNNKTNSTRGPPGAPAALEDRGPPDGAPGDPQGASAGAPGGLPGAPEAAAGAPGGPPGAPGGPPGAPGGAPGGPPGAPRDRGAPEEVDGVELSSEGFVVGVDAEFVAEVTEAAEIDQDGRKEILQGSSLALARLSLVRGQGPLEEVPFIDHYVLFKKPPKDCLTRFSGLRAEDLSLTDSVVWLSTRKSILQKMRFLVDCKCIFVGHGLQQDFRVMNLYVPAQQVIDTAYLFRIPGRRLLSLKFLSAFILQKNIQNKTHDSIEDAQTSLRLFRKYLQLRRSGCLYSCLEQLYQYGRLLNFSPPALPLKDFLESPKEQKEITENKFPNNSSFPR